MTAQTLAFIYLLQYSNFIYLLLLSFINVFKRLITKRNALRQQPIFWIFYYSTIISILYKHIGLSAYVTDPIGSHCASNAFYGYPLLPLFPLFLLSLSLHFYTHYLAHFVRRRFALRSEAEHWARAFARCDLWALATHEHCAAMRFTSSGGHDPRSLNIKAVFMIF